MGELFLIFIFYGLPIIFCISLIVNIVKLVRTRKIDSKELRKKEFKKRLIATIISAVIVIAIISFYAYIIYQLNHIVENM